MNKRIAALVAVVAAVIIALLLWHSRSDDSATRTAATGSAGSAGLASGSARSAKGRVVDPTTLGRATVAGTITVDEAAKPPVPGAQVCAYGRSPLLASELFAQPTCATADDKGRYQIGNLLPGEYRIGASARTFKPRVFHAPGERANTTVFLRAAEARDGVDIGLVRGGVEVTGTVIDVTGGVVANARVWQGSFEDGITASTEADENGAFSVWVAPGYQAINATADGYDAVEHWVNAPRRGIEVVLTPESTLAGTVVDGATGAPVAGARVQHEEWSEARTWFTDEAGAFRIGKLTPGRYVVFARSSDGYGRSEGSTLVGLGEHATGVVVKLFPAVRVSARVVISGTRAPCPEPAVNLTDTKNDRRIRLLGTGSNGELWFDGVLPGTYDVAVWCRGYTGRDSYERLVVADKPLSDIVWEVDAGAELRGVVRTRSGKPVDDAWVTARSSGSTARASMEYASAKTGSDGAYLMKGLKPGAYKLEVDGDGGAMPKDGVRVTVEAGATLTKDIVLDDVGTISGVIVDDAGAPVTKASAMAWILVGGSATGSGNGASREVDDAGAFTLEGLRPGEYRVMARRSWSEALRKPGSTDDAKQGEKVTVVANQTATVRLVVEAMSGMIKGIVLDTAGQPVTDAYVSSKRESDAAGAQASSISQTRWSWDDKPVITGTDGSFTLEKLSPGNYTIFAHRRGGGEAVAEHVPVGTKTATLKFKPTASLRGVATYTGGARLDDLEVTVTDRKTGFWRGESFYMTGGTFFVDDLPKGHFDLEVTSGGNRKRIEIDLAEGETKKDLRIELEGSITVRGRAVDAVTRAPIAGIRMNASPAIGSVNIRMMGGGSEDKRISDDAGAFVIENAPRGRLLLTAFPKNWGDSDYSAVEMFVQPSPTGDLGDVGLYKKRVKRGDTVGDLGFHSTQEADDVLPDDHVLRVSYIDPAGPAAKTDLRVGDIITSIDGIDISGANYHLHWNLARVAPGVKVVFGLARGGKVEITAAAP